MILKNTSNSRKELTNRQTGELLSVEAGKTIELAKALYDENTFEEVEEEKKTKLKEDK